MNEFDTVLAALERKADRPVPTPDAPKSFAIRVSGQDDDEGSSDAEELLDVVGLALGITYVDSQGDKSRRRITVRSLVSRGDVLMVNAYCHEREAVRQFRIDRIEELVVLSTGEVIEDAAGFFDRLAGRDPTAEALAGCRHALQVLTFLARCDGHLHPAEQAEIAEFVIENAPRPLEIDEKRVRQHVSALYPDQTSYCRALRAIRFSGGDQMRQLSRAIRRVLDADGLLHDSEFEWALEAQNELPQR